MTKLLSSLAVATLGSVLSFAAFAQSVKVEDAWARSTVAGQQAGGVFMTLESDRKAALVGVKSPEANKVEIHEMKNEGGVMKMRPLPRLELPAGKKVSLAPGGYHLMVIGIKKPLTAGEKLPITLTVEDENKKTSTVEVNAEIRPAANAGSQHHHMHH